MYVPVCPHGCNVPSIKGSRQLIQIMSFEEEEEEESLMNKVLSNSMSRFNIILID